MDVDDGVAASSSALHSGVAAAPDAATSHEADAPPASALVPASALLPLQPSSETHELVHCCRRCRQPLLRPANVTDHERGQQSFSYRRQAKERAVHGGAADAEGQGDGCTSYFLAEPLQWMKVRAAV